VYPFASGILLDGGAHGNGTVAIAANRHKSRLLRSAGQVVAGAAAVDFAAFVGRTLSWMGEYNGVDDDLSLTNAALDVVNGGNVTDDLAAFFGGNLVDLEHLETAEIFHVLAV
jgi:hypothetical protein